MRRVPVKNQQPTKFCLPRSSNTPTATGDGRHVAAGALITLQVRLRLLFHFTAIMELVFNFLGPADEPTARMGRARCN